MRAISSLIIGLMAIQFGWSQQPLVLIDLQQNIENYTKKLNIDEPNQMDPLTLNATLVWSEDKTQLAVIIKAELLEGWHTYAYVPKTQPYIQTNMVLKLPDGITKINNWNKPPSKPYQQGVYIYSGELIFIQYCSVEKLSNAGKITTGLYYQTCDLHKCFPPETKTIDLVLN